jgi:hypothetical protein
VENDPPVPPPLLAVVQVVPLKVVQHTAWDDSGGTPVVRR